MAVHDDNLSDQAVAQLEPAPTAVVKVDETGERTEVSPSPAALIQFDAYLNCTLATGEGLEALGLVAEDVAGHTLHEGLPPAMAALLAPVVEAGLRGQETVMQREVDGVWLEAQSIPKLGGLGGRSVFCVIRDVSLRHKSELELGRSRSMMFAAQKTEAVARLAGGVAHEFRNLLTGIRGYTRLLMDEKPWGHPDRDSLSKINRAVDRASGLVQQLLAFGRTEVTQPRVFDLANVVRESAGLLRSILGEAIVLDVDLTESVRAEVDRRQMEQILVTLALNAREAMPGGGMVRLAVERARMPHDEASHQLWAVISMSDTGPGIPPEVSERIFEPFFTTKKSGLGLGLPAAEAIVQAHGGCISVQDSENGGTVFQIFLPATEDPGMPSRGTASDQATSARILVVDDDVGVREVVARILRRLGYHVDEAEDAGEALTTLEKMEQLPDLLLTDVVMPGMNGRELSERVNERYPEVRVLFMSAYTADEVLLRGIKISEVSFVPKPFTVESLAASVNEALKAPV